MSCIDFKAQLPGTLGTYQVTWYYMNLGTRSVTYTFVEVAHSTGIKP